MLMYVFQRAFFQHVDPTGPAVDCCADFYNRSLEPVSTTTRNIGKRTERLLSIGFHRMENNSTGIKILKIERRQRTPHAALKTRASF